MRPIVNLWPLNLNKGPNFFFLKKKTQEFFYFYRDPDPMYVATYNAA